MTKKNEQDFKVFIQILLERSAKQEWYIVFTKYAEKAEDFNTPVMRFIQETDSENFMSVN